MRRKEGQPYYSNDHSCFLLQYHLVLVTKFRHPVITGNLRQDLYSEIREIMDRYGYNILEINGEEDHVHILFETDTEFRVDRFVNMLKTQTSRQIRKTYADTALKGWYWENIFWAKGYFISSVSENSLSTIQKYIQDQGKN